MSDSRSGPIKLLGLLVLGVCVIVGLSICGFTLDALLGVANDAWWARVVRWVATFAVVVGLVWAYDAWKSKHS